MKKIKASIVGVTGYAGEELLKILSRHKGVDISGLFGRSSGELRALRDIYPQFEDMGLNVEALDTKKIADISDVVFLALPHKLSFDIVPHIIKTGLKIIDLSADYRLKSAEVYEKWYAVPHGSKELLPMAVYGLPEIYRQKIINASLIANPGCYPTMVILGLYPALKNGLLDTDSIIIDAKSGISGAGRKALEEYYKQEHPNFRPYNISGAHRHIPEIEQELSIAAGKELNVTFTPQIIPMERGMISAIYAKPAKKTTIEDLIAVYKDYYVKEAFVRVLDGGKIPDVRSVVNTGFCDIGMKLDERTGRLVIISAQDNLLKGASSQAVQNMNILYGFLETEGIL